jgi:toxin ParE1/3/4
LYLCAFRPINQLLDNPEIGRARDEVKTGYRSLNIKKHIIFYKIQKTDIQILGVIHGRMDIATQF